METKFIVNPNAKADYSSLGEKDSLIRELLESKEISLTERIELLKLGITAIDKRIQLKMEERKNVLADIQIDEYNRRYGTNFKRRNIELKDFDWNPEYKIIRIQPPVEPEI